eukprot:845493-Prorocentrum_minimum.AAC.2
MLPPLTRLVRAAGICSHPSLDWFAPRVCAPCPRSIGSRHGYMLPPLTLLVALRQVNVERALKEQLMEKQAALELKLMEANLEKERQV